MLLAEAELLVVAEVTPHKTLVNPPDVLGIRGIMTELTVTMPHTEETQLQRPEEAELAQVLRTR